MLDQGSTLTRRDPQIRRAPAGSAGLYDVLDLILDKGIVIDAFVRVSLVGIELLTVVARVVIASVDTYLRYAEGAERLQLYARSQSVSLPEFVEDKSKKGAASQVAKTGAKAAGRIFNQDDDEQEEGKEKEEGIGGTLRKAVGKIVHTVTGGGEEDEDKDQEKEQKPAQHGRHSGNGSGKPAKAGARR